MWNKCQSSVPVMSVIPLRIIPSLWHIELDLLKTENGLKIRFCPVLSDSERALLLEGSQAFPFVPIRIVCRQWWLRSIDGLIHVQTHKILSYTISNLRNSKKAKKKRASNYSLREWKRSETKVTEEYCWAITQAAGPSCCGRSGSSVLQCGFHMQLTTRICEFWLAPWLPERSYCGVLVMGTYCDVIHTYRLCGKIHNF
jgi:hypothetical protein